MKQTTLEMSALTEPVIRLLEVFPRCPRLIRGLTRQFNTTLLFLSPSREHEFRFSRLMAFAITCHEVSLLYHLTEMFLKSNLLQAINIRAMSTMRFNLFRNNRKYRFKFVFFFIVWYRGLIIRDDMNFPGRRNLSSLFVCMHFCCYRI